MIRYKQLHFKTYGVKIAIRVIHKAWADLSSWSSRHLKNLFSYFHFETKVYYCALGIFGWTCLMCFSGECLFYLFIYLLLGFSYFRQMKILSIMKILEC